MTPEGEPEEPQGRVRPTGPGLLVCTALVGLVGGWLVRPVSAWLDAAAPLVGWVQPLLLLFVAAVLGGTAWVTWRQVHQRREYLEPHRAVNRLVLAKACAIVGALVAGGYAGYALTWLGVEASLAGQRGWRSAIAAVAGLLIALASLLLERACRVRKDDPTP